MSGSDYSFFSRLTHRLALQNPAIAGLSFDIGSAVAGKTVNSPRAPVFVSGLARSGTTILTQYLYQTGSFASLTYRDMPFVLMPSIWRRIAGRRNPGQLKERAHQDHIMVNLDSPEAFEEVFWRVFCGNDYISAGRLQRHSVNAGMHKKFKRYISSVLAAPQAPGQNRYLSKNNNNILRLAYLANAFPNAGIVIPFRHPLQHSAALLQQHLHFSALQASDRFTLDYMNWLGHFEFGLNQMPFYLGDEDILQKMRQAPKNELDFWLLSWKNYYQYVLLQDMPQLILFDYDRFCADPSGTLARLWTKLAIQRPPAILPFQINAKATGPHDQNLLRECLVIYHQLAHKAGLVCRVFNK